MIATVLPAYNEPRERLLASVASALAVSDLVVVSDDGSREPIEPWYEHPNVEIVRQSNKGPAAAMNAGVYAALSLGATRIARLDVGDTFLPDAKLRQLARTEPALASWHIDGVSGNEFRSPKHWRNIIYRDGVFCVCTCVVSADVWRAVGGFDESLMYGDDWDWTMRVQHAVGWQIHEGATCVAGAFAGGHTMSAEGDARRRQLRNACIKEVHRKSRMLRGRV